jgi:hypothetical protein
MWPGGGIEVPIAIRRLIGRCRRIGIASWVSCRTSSQLMRRSDGEKCVDRKDVVPSPELIGLMPVGVPINQRDDDQPLDQLISDLPVGDS